MLEELGKAVTVYFSCMVKFIFGPVLGYVAGLHLITTILTTIAGSMTVVLVLSFFGEWLKKKYLNPFLEKRKRFTSSNRRYVTIWKKYGLFGLAALTPILLTPIGGTLLSVTFGAPRNKLIIYMLVSVTLWSVILSVTVYVTGNALPDFFPSFMRE